MADRAIRLEEVREHNSAESCWIVLHGAVYDVTEFREEHPGGEEILLEACAEADASQMFDDVGHSSDARAMLARYKIGTLATGDDAAAAAVPGEVLLSFDPPSELVFPPAANGVMTKLRVANPAPQRVIFKVLSTNPPRYYVKPNGGVIAEGAVLDISFSLADTSGIGDKVDKFLVEWMWDSDFPEPIPQDVDGAVGWKAFFAKVSKRNAKAVKKVKLSCRIREAGEEHDSPTRFNLAGPLERSHELEAERREFERLSRERGERDERQTAKLKAAEAKLKAGKEKLVKDRKRAADVSKPPAYWEHVDRKPGANSFRYKDVTARMKDSIQWAMNKWAQPRSHGTGADSHKEKFKKFEVLKVRMVQNPQLWQKYVANRGISEDVTKGRLGSKTPLPTMSKFRPPAPFDQSPLAKKSNEFYMFHGFDEGLRDILAQQGFDPRLGKGYFGQGTYFAESASKSDQYVQGRSLNMCMARVTLGSPHVTFENMRDCVRPPDIDGKPIGGDRPRCHSVIFDNTKLHMRFREFVVYDLVSAYPEFLIEYRRTR